MKNLSKASQVVKGDIIWYVDNVTGDVIYATQGEDNKSFYSYAGVKDGVFAHPQALSHYDMWFTESYSLPEVKGMIKLRIASEESFQFKDIEVQHKFNQWSTEVLAGKISSDGNEFLVYTQGVDKSALKKIAGYFSKLHLIKANSVVLLSNQPFGTVKDLFMESQMATAAPIQVVAQVEDAAIVQLVEQFKNGSQEAGEQLYEKYHKSIKDVMWGFIKNNPKMRAKQEDIENELSLEFLRALKRYDGSTKLSTFVYNTLQGIMKNILNPVRNQDDQQMNIGNESGDEEQTELNLNRVEKDYRDRDSEKDNSDYLNSDFLKEVMEQQLDSKLFKIVSDYFFEGKTLKEIGTETGTSGEYVRQLIEKALDKLRKHPDMSTLADDMHLSAESIKIGMIFNESREATDSSTSLTNIKQA